MKKLFLLCFLLWNVPAWATIYYTAKDCSGGSAPPLCSDSNTGTTRQTAELTIAAGVAHLSGGDTLIIGDGTYTEAMRDVLPAGSAGAPTIIQAEHFSTTPVIGGGRPAVPVILRPTGGDNVIKFNANYITINGIDADAVNADSSPYDGYNGGSDVTHIIIENGRARNGNGNVSSSSCILGNFPDGQILNMEIDGCSTGGTNQDHGIYAQGPRLLVDGNFVHDIEGYCLTQYPGTDNNIARNNIFRDCTNRGVDLYGTGGLFYNNILDSNGWGLEQHGTSTLIYSNTIYNNGHASAGQGQQCIDALSGTSTAKNNICYLNEQNSIQQNGGTITETFNVATNPNFTNAAAHNFTLTSGSSAINAGTVLGAPYDIDITGAARGSVYDAGAYEFGAVGGTPNYKRIFQSPVIHR